MSFICYGRVFTYAAIKCFFSIHLVLKLFTDLLTYLFIFLITYVVVFCNKDKEIYEMHTCHTVYNILHFMLFKFVI